MNLGLPEIIVIVVVILIVFGPSKIPELSRAIGRGLREFRKAMRDLEDTWAGTEPSEEDAATSKASPQNDKDAMAKERRNGE